MCQTQWESKRRTPAGSSLAGVLLFCTNLTQPTGALDKKTGTQIMELLHSVVKENGIMLLLVTHDPDIADTCDTIFEMDGGRITCAKNDT